MAHLHSRFRVLVVHNAPGARSPARHEHGERGETIIESKGVKHTIVFTTDPIRRTPEVIDTQTPSTRFVHSGTSITVKWPVSAHGQNSMWLRLGLYYSPRSIDPQSTPCAHPDVGRQQAGYPRASDPTWLEWPREPLVAHWYNHETFDRLIRTLIAHDEDHGRETLVREFIAKFKGMKRSGDQAAVLDTIDAHRMSLETLFKTGRQRILLRS